MRRQLRLRFAEDKDLPAALEALSRNGDFDKRVLGYPTAQMLCAGDTETLGYLPCHRVLMVESTGLKEGLSESDKAQALRDLMKGMTLVASSHAIREIFFYGTDERLLKMAEQHGFEDISKKYTVMRMRL